MYTGSPTQFKIFCLNCASRDWTTLLKVVSGLTTGLILLDFVTSKTTFVLTPFYFCFVVYFCQVCYINNIHTLRPVPIPAVCLGSADDERIG